MAKKHPSTTAPAEPDGHFGTGLFVGTVVGAIGMFLFGTDAGQTILRQMREELENQVNQVEPEVKEQLEQTRTLIAKAMDAVQDKVAEATENKPVQSAEFPKFKRKNSS